MRSHTPVDGSRFEDGFGRIHDDLRVSVTDRCNLRCAYCMPEEPIWFERDALLAFEETARLVAIAVRRGIRSVRLTGGEPLLRRDVATLVRLVATIPGVEDLSLTTNGILLDRFSADLAAAGLRRINVSLDTLDPDRFERLTRRRLLDRVLGGIAAARAAGLGPIKLNTVLLRGVNDDELEPIVEHARDHGWEPRFIEYMPLDNDGAWNLERVVTGDEARRRVAARWALERDPDADPRAPASSWRFADGRGRVGFIDSVTRPFCGSCSRLRLTSDGMFRVCLYDDVEADLKTPLRAGASDDELAALMDEAVRRKGRGGALEILERRQALPLRRTMHQIGG